MDILNFDEKAQYYQCRLPRLAGRDGELVHCMPIPEYDSRYGMAVVIETEPSLYQLHYTDVIYRTAEPPSGSLMFWDLPDADVRCGDDSYREVMDGARNGEKTLIRELILDINGKDNGYRLLTSNNDTIKSARCAAGIVLLGRYVFGGERTIEIARDLDLSFRLVTFVVERALWDVAPRIAIRWHRLSDAVANDERKKIIEKSITSYIDSGVIATASKPKKSNLDIPSLMESINRDYVILPEAARIIGVSRQAIATRSKATKLQMGGIKTPFGWMFRRDRLGYRPPTGRPKAA